MKVWHGNSFFCLKALLFKIESWWGTRDITHLTHITHLTKWQSENSLLSRTSQLQVLISNTKMRSCCSSMNSNTCPHIYNLRVVASLTMNTLCWICFCAAFWKRASLSVFPRRNVHLLHSSSWFHPPIFHPFFFLIWIRDRQNDFAHEFPAKNPCKSLFHIGIKDTTIEASPFQIPFLQLFLSFTLSLCPLPPLLPP